VTEFSTNPVLATIGPQYNVFPFYTLVDAVTLKNMESLVFDTSDILIAFDSDYEGKKKYSVGARTLKKSLVGEHLVKVKVRRTATSAAFYTNSFVITVVDPCNPVVCSRVSFYPETYEAPEDIWLTVNEPLVQSESSYWTSNHAGWCGDKPVWAACGMPNFYLYDADTNLPITDFQWRIDNNLNRLRLQVIATDENIRGNSYNVFILGVPINELSKGNQTLPFVI